MRTTFKHKLPKHNGSSIACLFSTHSQESRTSSAKKVAQYLAQAMGCYMEAVQIDSSERTRIHLPKCLWMLTKDGSSPGVLCQTLESRGSELPVWVWLPWIPQLLSSLCRIEGHCIKSILSRLVKAYPQAVYYSLRAFYLERRDVERSKGVSSSSPGQHMSSVAYAEEMMSTLRRSHASLWSSLEAILEELIVKFRPSFEEELLATISALLERAESHTEKQAVPDDRKSEDEDAMVSSWSKTLSRIAAKFFRDSESSSNSNRRDDRAKRTAEFKRKYKTDFEADFKVNSASSETSGDKAEAKPQFQLEEYIERLQKWKDNLEVQVSRTPRKLPLVESSHALAMFVGNIPDLWPGSCDPKYLQTRKERDSSLDIESMSGQPTTSSSAAAAKKAAIVAAQTAATAAAKEGVGGEYGGGSAAIEIPGQYCPNSWRSSDVRPSPELHTKLVRFEPYVEILRRNDQLVRRATMIGSDGKKHKFLLQFAIPYWTRTDERTAQTHYVVDKFLRKNIMSARNNLSIQPNPAIPVAQRLRMTLDVDTRLSLDEVVKNASAQASLIPYGKIPAHFLEEITTHMKDKINGSTSDEDKKVIEKNARLAVYQEVCEKHSKKSLLLDQVRAALDGPESMFQFRRAFSAQLAANSLLQYVFSAAERTPSRFVLMQCNGRLLSPDFRISYTNQGELL
jgi:transformation/transcription domain-associated protein